MQEAQRRAILVGADMDMAEVRRHYQDHSWLAHIAEPSLADGFVLDHKPDVVVVSPRAADRAAMLAKRHPNVSVIAHTPNARSEESLEGHDSDHRSSVQEHRYVDSAPSDQTLVAVWSPKGGVGKSFIATNLAVAVALSTQAPVALLDLDLHSPDLGVYLDLLDGPTIVEVLPHLSSMRSHDLEQYMSLHAGTGIRVLLGPRRPELADFVRAEQVTTIVELARRRFNHLFIDLPPHAGEDMVYECLEQATSIVLVTTQDAATLRQTRLTLETLSSLCIDVSGRVRVVLNRYHEQDNVSVVHVEDFVGQPVVATIREDRVSTEKALFQGTPLIMTNRSPALCNSLQELAHQLCLGNTHSPKRTEGLWATLRRRVLDGITRAS